tara:strand:+ start:569 stop:910 length:342 start_codon:yes stop_codon:yes gene_type:complete
MKTKKELKEAYKQMVFPMGVFQIKNLTNGKFLVDNSIDMQAKWNRHKMELKFGNHKNKELQKDWNNMGESNFVFEIISELKPNEEKISNYTKDLLDLQHMVMEEMGDFGDNHY